MINLNIGLSQLLNIGSDWNPEQLAIMGYVGPAGIGALGVLLVVVAVLLIGAIGLFLHPIRVMLRRLRREQSCASQDTTSAQSRDESNSL